MSEPTIQTFDTASGTLCIGINGTTGGDGNISKIEWDAITKQVHTITTVKQLEQKDVINLVNTINNNIATITNDGTNQTLQKRVSHIH